MGLVIFAGGRAARFLLIWTIDQAANSMAADIVAVGIVVWFPVSVELRRRIDLTEVIRSVNITSNAVTAIIVVRITVVARRVMVLLRMIRQHSFNNRSQYRARYYPANIMASVIVLACSRIKPVATTVMIATHIRKHTRTPLSHPYIAAFRVVSPCAV
ncbi:hypothetical protein A4G21_07545 [Brucella intermedia]|nr:hypothetical protein A4G21_07545 [Brucella intermedia]